MRLTLLLATLFLLIVACGGGEEAATSTTSEPESSTTSTTKATTTTSNTLPSTSTTRAATTTTVQEIDVSFEGGVVNGPERIAVTLADEVSVWVLSDEEAEIHVHGYDLFFDATAGVPVDVTFIADVPGIFEVEVEGSHTILFQLEVTG
jgi:hypothetical protein